MAKRLFELSEDEMRAFRRQEQHTRAVHELKRLQAVRLYGSGMSIADILKIVDTSEFAALRSKWQGNNAKKLSDGQRGDLRERLHQGGPATWQFSAGQFWTVSDLERAVEQWYGVHYHSRRSYVSLMHECGFSYQRAEKVYRSRSHEWDIADFEAELEKK